MSKFVALAFLFWVGILPARGVEWNEYEIPGLEDVRNIEDIEEDPKKKKSLLEFTKRFFKNLEKIKGKESPVNLRTGISAGVPTSILVSAYFHPTVPNSSLVNRFRFGAGVGYGVHLNGDIFTEYQIPKLSFLSFTASLGVSDFSPTTRRLAAKKFNQMISDQWESQGIKNTFPVSPTVKPSAFSAFVFSPSLGARLSLGQVNIGLKFVYYRIQDVLEKKVFTQLQNQYVKSYAEVVGPYTSDSPDVDALRRQFDGLRERTFGQDGYGKFKKKLDLILPCRNCAVAFTIEYDIPIRASEKRWKSN